MKPGGGRQARRAFRERSAIRSLRRRPVPAWWRDAKLGIFVHWTPASVPAFAPTADEIVELLRENSADALSHSPYAEWYENSLRFNNSPAARYHRQHYGDRPYRSFMHDWEAALAQWDPSDWAERFAATGARYVVLVTKHMDGYCLWPSDVANPGAPEAKSGRDVVGELAAAVRARGLRFGVYYSGGLDSTFNDYPIGRFTDLVLAQPRGAYLQYAEAQLRELIDRYAPSVLWNDISWPAPLNSLSRILSYYYEAVPDGVVNDRFLPWSPLWLAARSHPVRLMIDRLVAEGARRGRGIVPPAPPLFDFRTPEYTVFDSIQTTPWECVRGMDKSFGYNKQSTDADFLTRRDLLWMLADITSKNGNLLLNVGPRGEDAGIADQQLERLDWLKDFMMTGSDAIHGTRPWIFPDSTAEGYVDVRYTTRDRDVFAFIRSSRLGAELGAVTLPEISLGPLTRVVRLDNGRVSASRLASGVRLEMDPPAGPDVPVVIRLRDVTATRRT